jgi:hypothetical protein
VLTLKRWGWLGSVCQLFDDPVPIGDMDLVGLLKKNEQPLRNCCVVVGALQRRDSLTLSVGVPLSTLNAQFGVFKKVFQVRAGHKGLNQPTSPPRLCAFSHTTFGDAGLLSGRPAVTTCRGSHAVRFKVAAITLLGVGEAYACGAAPSDSQKQRQLAGPPPGVGGLNSRRQHPVDRGPPNALPGLHRKAVAVAHLIPALEADQYGQRGQ